MVLEGRGRGDARGGGFGQESESGRKRTGYLLAEDVAETLFHGGVDGGLGVAICAASCSG